MARKKTSRTTRPAGDYAGPSDQAPEAETGTEAKPIGVDDAEIEASPKQIDPALDNDAGSERVEPIGVDEAEIAASPSLVDPALDETAAGKAAADAREELPEGEAGSRQSSDAGGDTVPAATGESREGNVAPAEVAAPAATPPPQVIEKRGPGFFALLLGGLLAGGIGYAVATFGVPRVEEAAVDAARVETLEGEVAALRSDLSGMGDLPAAGVDLAPLQTSLAELEDRVATLESRPAAPATAEGDATPAAPAPSAPTPDLAPLQDRIASVEEGVSSTGNQVADLATRIDTAEADLAGRITALEARIADLSEGADDAAALARETAQNQLSLAVETGAPFAEQAEMLGDLPEPLTAAAAEGVPTVSDLAVAFPPLAREALRAARTEGGGEAGLQGIARSLLGARSLEPREGDDPDAVLSRAEAAVRAGDLSAALSEIAALPESARAVLSDWTSRAETRIEAEAALQDYLEG
ncbi:COG4223 family protein [Jannaschia aquimarina]|uniref:Mitochondrial inner membrane protein n=1 Tax=Jannaschia aquimarina TaxID=935700 RepID=A0A0D1CKT7_9RHOB|nr:mitofilin family membrane protein [Jannaschia aquimarina]KIT15397.1 Mitochondrial inner membrane protein [Jannaschia aquimarina]SNT22900.1 Uncharacterized conserved protein [Jannaschia aquimarina]